ILLAFANSLPLLFLSRIIDGLSGANIATAQAVVSDVTSEKTRTQGLGLIGAAFGMGFIMGPTIAFITLAVTGGNYQAVAFAAAFFSLASILLTFFWLPETLDREKAAAYRAQRAFSLQNLISALRRPQIGILLVLMGEQQLAFGGYEQFFSLFTLNRLGMGATDTSGLFVLAGLLIVVIQGGFVGRWSRKYGDRWLVIMGLAALSAGLILTALTPQIPVWWYDRAKITAEVAGESTRNINVPLPPEENKGWLGIAWMLLASVPAVVGGGVLQPAINSLLTKSADPNQTGGTLGLSSAMYSLGNAIAPLFYGTLFQAFGAPTPFILGGLLLGALWIVATRTVKAPQTTV
ncbi:MAG: MFS transporter, partial [Anaerolineales bacterium]